MRMKTNPRVMMKKRKKIRKVLQTRNPKGKTKNPKIQTTSLAAKTNS